MRFESDSPDVRPFQVDLRGVVDLLSRHIYSSPQVFLRELLQNGRDAIRARHELDAGAPAGSLEIEPAGPGRPFRFRDNGVGLTADEASELLSTVGRSSKRDDLMQVRRVDYLGQFGIGLLSCFMVSDRIVVRSRSAKGTPAIEWIGDASGSFRIRELGEAETDGMAVGTEIALEPRPDDASLLSPDRVRALATRFGQYLPVPVAIVNEDATLDTVTRAPAFLGASAEEPSDALVELGTKLLGRRPLDIIPLSVPGTGTEGVAFVLPFAPPPGAHQASTVYLGRMLVGEQLDGLLPAWAFFVRCVLDTTGLAPTASREGLVDDSALEHTREQLGASVRAWILRQATTRPWRFQEFLSVHQLALKALAVHDDELARAVLPWLTVETSAGDTTVAELARRHDGVRYAESVDEFRQVAAIVPPETPVVNGGYSYDAALLRRLPDLLDVPVTRVTVSELLDELTPPPLAERALAVGLEERATAALAEVGCTVSARRFTPVELPALCVVDPEVVRRIERDAAQETAAGGIWGDVLGDVSELIEARRRDEGREAEAVRLCLNWSSPLVRRLADLRDELVFDRTVKLLYVQALLASHRPLAPADRRMLTSALTDMVTLSVGITGELEGEAL
ncbi:HSP90 family protein [Microbacterium betulae]|uniref:HSP90 family protein n=1 Tax=Microbacterium betulae TaxID=2981139 RepID=A0AA97FHH0_9MICO|nr:HSP90 family protein [Microbacterium sp. AB]WOF22993.1 HSP90 family protein [Microbacterium sp. AB]